MRRLYLLGWLLLSLPRLAGAQQSASSCDGSRYAADVFTDVSKTAGIVYGQNSVLDYSTNTSTPVTLALDFYEPLGDSAPQRPLLIFAFGGSFVSGQRQDMDDLCRAFALKGYATATIDYRLVPPGAGCPFFAPGCNYALVFNSPARVADQLVRASSDMKAAVRFFRHDAATTNTYRIDPARILMAGYSAGAITALQTAYIDSETEDATFTAAYQRNGGLEGNTDLPAPDNLLPTYHARDLAGTFSLAGGVATLGVVSAGNPPLFSVHGDADQVVPYTYGPVFGVSTYNLYGSGSIQPQAASVGITSQLLTLAGGDHASPRAPATRAAINTAAAQFFQRVVCGSPLPVTLVAFEGQLAAGTCAPTLSWRTASELRSQAYEVEQSANGRDFSLVGTVPSHNSARGSAYSLTLGPLRGRAYFRLKMRDQDNTFTYSPVLLLLGRCGQASLQAVPNPATQQVQLLGLPPGPSQVRLYEATGRLLRQAELAEQSPLDLSGLPAGLYLLQVASLAGEPLGQVRVLKQ